MRLIDADDLKEEMRAGCVPIDLGNITGITGDDDSIEDYIDAAPTIAAVPVGWLIDRANDPERAPLYRRYAQMLYEEWQQEQEAQDG